MSSKTESYEVFFHEPPPVPNLLELSHPSVNIHLPPRIKCAGSIIDFERKYKAFDDNKTKKNRDIALEASEILYGENGVLTLECINYLKRKNDGIENFRRKMETLRRHNSRSRSSQGGGSGATDLSSILPKNSFYPFNSNILANSVDSRAAVPQSHLQLGGGKRNRRRNTSNRSRSKSKRGSKRGSKHGSKRGSKRGSKHGSKRGYVNYAGRQIGCLSQRRSQRRSRRQKQRFAQSGGDAFSYLPQDLNMAARSATTFAGNLWADLQGTHNKPSPLPFSDQALQSTSGKPQ